MVDVREDEKFASKITTALRAIASISRLDCALSPIGNSFSRPLWCVNEIEPTPLVIRIPTGCRRLLFSISRIEIGRVGEDRPKQSTNSAGVHPDPPPRL